MRTWIAVFFALCITAQAADPVRVILEDADGTRRVFVPQAEPEPDIPEPIPARTNWGINLAGVSYWGTERVYTDLAKQASPWHWGTNGGWNNAPAGPIDANGYPSSVPTGVYAGMLLDGHAGLMGDVVVTPTDGVSVDNGSGGVFRFTSSNRLLARVKTGISTLSVRQVGDVSQELFASAFVERTKRFGIIRFMDWAQTNEDRPVSWSSRITPTWHTQADREVCLEHQIAIAELCDASPWFCVHHRADDEYVRQMARLVKAQYDGRRPIYVEHSNEVWNGQFTQYRYAVDRSPVTRSPLEYHARRTAEIATIFAAEGVDVVCVFGAQAAGLPTLEWVLTRTGPLPDRIDAVAIAPYFGGATPVDSKLAGPAAILAACRADLATVRTRVQAWKAYCDREQLQLLAYEGGQHAVPLGAERNNQAIVDAVIAANRSPEMGDIYRDYMRAWDEDTNHAPHCLFQSVSRPSKWGSWGLQEYEGETTNPKYRAAMDHMGLSP